MLLPHFERTLLKIVIITTGSSGFWLLVPDGVELFQRFLYLCEKNHNDKKKKKNITMKCCIIL